MLQFVSKKVVFVLLCAFALWAVPVNVIAADDPQDIEDAQNLSNILLITGLAIAVTVLVFTIVSGTVKRKKAENKAEKQKKVETSQSDSLKVEPPKL